MVLGGDNGERREKGADMNKKTYLKFQRTVLAWKLGIKACYN